MGFILTAFGLLLLVVALAGIGLGIYMAVEPKTRASGKLFAIWWVPGVAAASGVLMRDIVTFTVGVICFLIAGAVMVFEDSRPRKAPARKGSTWPEARWATDSLTPKRPPGEQDQGFWEGRLLTRPPLPRNSVIAILAAETAPRRSWGG